MGAAVVSSSHRELLWTNLKDAVELGRQFLLTVARGGATPRGLARRHAHGVSEQLANVNYLRRNTRTGAYIHTHTE